MNQMSPKAYIILAIVLFVILLLSLTIPFGNNDRTESTIKSLTPTSVETKRQVDFVPVTEAPIPTPIHPTFTGVKEQELPQSLKDLSDQKQSLKDILPIQEVAFTVTFDYAEDTFAVDLKEPKETAKTDFTSWLKTNYPALPEEKFIFK